MTAVTANGKAPRRAHKSGRWAEHDVALPFRIGAWIAFVVLLLPVVIVVLAGLNSV